MLPDKFPHAIAAAVRRIDVNNDELVSSDSEIGVGQEIAKPMFDDAAVGRA
jgi:hypothetical protein